MDKSIGEIKNDTLAIIGASFGQEKLFIKAKELGLRTIAFAWTHGAICKDMADVFYPISITETEQIVDICKKENVKGIVSNCSDVTAAEVSKLTTFLGLHGIPYSSFLSIRNKYAMRKLLNGIEELSQVWSYQYAGEKPQSYPCVVKPCIGASKIGVCFVHNDEQFDEAIKYAKDATSGNILVEQFIEGHEVSVESISFEGRHYVVQITDKDCTGEPHFVETGHHQPSSLSQKIQDKIIRITSRILNKINFQNGASHTEMKITSNGDVYIIEVNPRGGGDEISNTLVSLSTDYDYVKAMITVAIGSFTAPVVHNVSHAGIYYLCKQTKDYVEFFKNADGKPWLVKKEVSSYELREGTSNYDRNGYLIYKDIKKIEINE